MAGNPRGNVVVTLKTKLIHLLGCFLIWHMHAFAL